MLLARQLFRFFPHRESAQSLSGWWCGISQGANWPALEGLSLLRCSPSCDSSFMTSALHGQATGSSFREALLSEAGPWQQSLAVETPLPNPASLAFAERTLLYLTLLSKQPLWLNHLSRRTPSWSGVNVNTPNHHAYSAPQSFSSRANTDSLSFSQFTPPAPSWSPFDVKTLPKVSHRCFFSTSAPQSSSNESNAESATENDGSWFSRVKGMLGMKKDAASEESTEAGSEDFTFSKFESSIKQLRRLSSLGKFLQPTKTAVAGELLRVYANTEKILGVMSADDKRDVETLTVARKASLAESVGLTTIEFDKMVMQYTLAKQGHARNAKMKRDGTPLPKTPEEIRRFASEWMPEALNSSNPASSGARHAGRASPAAARKAAPAASAAAKAPRNALCPCGSKKKYKRCCGRDDSA